MHSIQPRNLTTAEFITQYALLLDNVEKEPIPVSWQADALRRLLMLENRADSLGL